MLPDSDGRWVGTEHSKRRHVAFFHLSPSSQGQGHSVILLAVFAESKVIQWVMQDGQLLCCCYGQLSTLSTVAMLLLRRILFDFVLGFKFVFLVSDSLSYPKTKKNTIWCMDKIEPLSVHHRMMWKSFTNLHMLSS